MIGRMPLPASKRVVFGRNPLYSVMAAINFPTILRIQAETPVAFQEAIRVDFPGYGLINPSLNALPTDIPTEIQAAVRASIAGIMRTESAHQFSSADGNWNVHLFSGSLTLVCKKYPRWEEFRGKLQSVLDPCFSIYKPPFASVVGLRYQNAIRRSELQLAGVPWSQLLKPFIAAELAAEGIAEAEGLTSAHRFELELGSAGRVQVQHGLAKYKPTS